MFLKWGFEMKCPECNGTKIRGHSRPFLKWEKLSIMTFGCDFCGETGKVTQKDLNRRAKGKKLRDDRVAREVTLRDEAKRLGIGVVELSNMERGIRPGAKPSKITLFSGLTPKSIGK
jgi:hypothetical protein